MKRIIVFFVAGMILSVSVSAGENLPYVYTGSVACLGIADGEIEYSKVPVNPDSVFAQGDDVYVLVELKDVVGKHRFQVKKFLEEINFGEYSTGWKNEEEKWVWSYSYFIPCQLDARPGNWRFDIYVENGEGGFELLDQVSFRVTRIDPDYIYTGSVACLGIADGEIEYSKVPVNPDSVFDEGDTVHILVELVNVYVNHQFMVKEYLNGDLWSEYSTELKEVGLGWSYSYFTPRQENARPGDWIFEIYLDKGNGFELLDSKGFEVLDEIPAEVGEESGPEIFSLRQNYPNPFNPTTTVSFVLAQSGYTCLEVFNPSGQKVVTLLDEYLGAGLHSVSWDAVSFSAGVYFYTIRTNAWRETRKMTLLK